MHHHLSLLPACYSAGPPFAAYILWTTLRQATRARTARSLRLRYTLRYIMQYAAMAARTVTTRSRRLRYTLRYIMQFAAMDHRPVAAGMGTTSSRRLQYIHSAVLHAVHCYVPLPCGSPHGHAVFPQAATRGQVT